MKKLLVLFIFCLASMAIFAQQSKKELSKGNIGSGKEIKKNITKGDMDQTKWIIESLDKYRSERSLASQLGILGIGVAGVSFAFENKPNDQRVLLITGGAFVAISYIISANSVRHLSKKNLTLTGNGLALRF